MERIALIGDRRQLRAVEAGQPFTLLQDAGMPTARMDEVVRQRDAGCGDVQLEVDNARQVPYAMELVRQAFAAKQPDRARGSEG